MTTDESHAEFRVVTPQQLAEGYLRRSGVVVSGGRYEIVRPLPDGNFVVRNPEYDLWCIRERLVEG